MKTISIGDIHGKSIWDTINPNNYDKIIFLGDYVDSFEINNSIILENLLNIIRFKKDNPDKVILLWGNHDLQYLFSYNSDGCSGYRPEMYDQLHQIFNDNKQLFQMSYQINDTIWAHAGIHQGWFTQRFEKLVKKLPDMSIYLQLNTAFYEKHDSLFDVGHRRGGYHDVGGPFWCDKEELKSSPIKKYHQIVGHNRVKEITKFYKYNKEIVFIDTLESDNPKFYEKEFK